MKMQKESRNFLMFILGILMVSVVGLSIAYALLSVTLNIVGSAEVSSAEWDVKFSNVSGQSLNNGIYTLPSVSNTSLSNFDVTMVTGGDGVEYTFMVQNNGSIDAKLSSIVIGTPVCESEASTDDLVVVDSSYHVDEDACNYINSFLYQSLTYEDGVSVSVGDVIYAGESVNLKYTVKINENKLYFSKDKISLSDFNASLIYTQN